MKNDGNSWGGDKPKKQYRKPVLVKHAMLKSVTFSNDRPDPGRWSHGDHT